MPGRLNYTHEDYLNLFIIYGECDKVLSRTCDIFANRYPEKQKPSPNSLKRIFENFKNYGTVKAPIHKKKPIVDDEAIEIAILGYFAAYPMLSLRYVARQAGISKDSIHRILLKHDFHPYSISLVQHLKDTDLPRTVQFCEFILTMFQDDFRFLDNIIWTDEAKFTKNGLFNRHNSHFWCDSNPHAMRIRNYQETWQFNVYCAVRNDGVKLHFYEENLNGEGYLNILHLLDNEYSNNLPLADHRQIFYQHDGAPPHNSFRVDNFLQETYNDHWIANNGPFLWPPRSPDLSVLDYFIWGTIKDTVYFNPVTTMEDCKARVRNAFQNLSPGSIRAATHDELLRMYEKCLEVQGGHFEHLLKK